MNFLNEDKEKIQVAYRDFLLQLKKYLQQYSIENELEYCKILFQILHSGLFSMDGILRFDNNFDYLPLPLTLSQGVQVMYGVCCCRHASEFLNDLSGFLNLDSSLMYVWIDSVTGTWHKVNPAVEKANHQVILFHNGKYIADPANKFFLEVQDGGKLYPFSIESYNPIKAYEDENIRTIGKTLKKYYVYRELGVERIY